MANETPKQMWETTFMLKNGQGVTVHHDTQPQDLDNKMAQGPQVVIMGKTQEKDWPVYFRCNRNEIIGWFSKPSGQYIGQRPNLVSV